MERENANFQKALASVQEFSDIRLIPIQLPWGEKAEFKGVIDLLTMKAYKGDGRTAVEIPAEFQSAAEEARMALVEAAAEGDDTLLEKYLETGELTSEEVLKGLKSVVKSSNYIPVLVSSGTLEFGLAPILDAIISLFPSPAEVGPAMAQGKDGDENLLPSDSGPLAAYVWKTTADPFVGRLTYFRVYSGVMASDGRVWNQTKSVEERFGTLQQPRGKENAPAKVFHVGDIGAVSKLAETSTGNTLCDRTHPLALPIPQYPNALYRVAVMPKTQADSTKISPTLTRLCEEDMTLTWKQ